MYVSPSWAEAVQKMYYHYDDQLSFFASPTPLPEKHIRDPYTLHIFAQQQAIGAAIPRP